MAEIKYTDLPRWISTKLSGTNWNSAMQLIVNWLTNGSYDLVVNSWSASADCDMNSNKITELGTPSANTDAATKLYVDDNTTPDWFIDRLKSQVNSTDSNNDIDISVGKCKDAAKTGLMEMSSALTKKADVTWVQGTDAGGFIPYSTETSKAASKSYAILLITNGTYTDVGIIHYSALDTDGETLLSAGLTAVATATSWTEANIKYRRIGSKKTDASGYWMLDEVFGSGEEIITKLSYSSDTRGVTEMSSNQVVAKTNLTLSTVPAGKKYRPLLAVEVHNNYGAIITLFDLNTNSYTSVEAKATYGSINTTEINTIYTNTSGQIAYSKTDGSPGGHVSKIISYGFIDLRRPI